MRALTLLVLLMAYIFPATAQQPGTLADSANAAYARGHYQKALTLYDSVYRAGYESAGLYYNLGNAYFKTDDIAHAILFYERGLKLAPGDEDILQNLEMARQLTLDKIEKVPELFYERWWKEFQNLTTANGWTYMLMGAMLILFAMIAIFVISNRLWIKKTSFYTGLVLVLVVAVSLTFSIKQYNSLVKENDAIVFNPSVTVKGSPDKESIDLFVIHEGTKVYIQEKLGNWYEIKIDNGSVGWIPAGAVKVI